MAETTMKELLFKISAKINTNVFTMILYFCAWFLTIYFVFDVIEGNPIKTSKIFEQLFLGVFTGLFFRFVVMKKNFTNKSKHGEDN